jgi:hypothetical protein
VPPQPLPPTPCTHLSKMIAAKPSLSPLAPTAIVVLFWNQRSISRKL